MHFLSNFKLYFRILSLLISTILYSGYPIGINNILPILKVIRLI